MTRSSESSWRRRGSTFDACYRSIVGECWRSDLRALDRRRTERCHAGADDYLELGSGLDDALNLPVVTGG